MCELLADTRHYKVNKINYSKIFVERTISFLWRNSIKYVREWLFEKLTFCCDEDCCILLHFLQVLLFLNLTESIEKCYLKYRDST